MNKRRVLLQQLLIDDLMKRRGKTKILMGAGMAIRALGNCLLIPAQICKVFSHGYVAVCRGR